MATSFRALQEIALPVSEAHHTVLLRRRFADPVDAAGEDTSPLKQDHLLTIGEEIQEGSVSNPSTADQLEADIRYPEPEPGEVKQTSARAARESQVHRSPVVAEGEPREVKEPQAPPGIGCGLKPTPEAWWDPAGFRE